MHDVPSPAEPQAVPVPRLLVELTPRWRVFFGNFRDSLLVPRLHDLQLQSEPAPFWPDVFVRQPLPWGSFVESGAYHVLAFGALLVFSQFAALQPRPITRPTFERSQVIYYQPSEYLPPLDTRSSESREAQKSDPEFSRQPIISVPAEADNHSQTIVAAPDVRLNHGVPMPNVVAWSDKPQIPIAPAPLVPAASITRIAPEIDNSVIAPAPDAARLQHERDLPTMQAAVVAPPPDAARSARSMIQAPEAAVIAPPPALDNDPTRTLGEMNIGRSAVIAPAPQLAVSEQRVIPGALKGAPATGQVVPPPPSVSPSAGASGGGARLIALNLHPAVGAPAEMPAGNRRGSFAATPEGHAGASGNPGSAAAGSSATSAAAGNASGSPNGAKNGNRDLPAGLYVGPAAAAKASPVAGNPSPKTLTASNTVNPKLMASLPPPRVTGIPARTLEPGNEARLSEVERAVFGGRRFYSLTLNMPNLNSAGGSWVIRFAELKRDAASGNLSAPYATRKVDPAYPIQLMKENVAGTVILYAVIHADGSVADVRVLRSVDDRIDRFASEAVTQWRFQPATKNGDPVDVEATFQIPFRPARVGSNF